MDFDDVVNATVNVLRKAHTELPEDVVTAIRNAHEREENEIARRTLETILKNVEAAKKLKVPMCQDTGIPVFFVEIGRDLRLEFDLCKAIREGVRRATLEIPLRPNAVHPITRENSRDNTGVHIPQINLEIVEGDELKITAMPKGAGSENVSALKMMLPTEVNKIRDFVVETVLRAGGKPCPPIFVGIGIGGTFDGAAKLAKKALLRNVLEMNEFEFEILKAINDLGVGPMGLGGKTTALAVLCEIGHCHTASLPVAVNIQCWANRRAEVVLR
ncbi:MULTISPECIES: fumarate hydratase [unclassified Archaeoglobus]|uniref:fumarate hydratase n=1 Tax=unclassified Archaeoglobus TaxID=2643606 RepID=UPI0025BD0D52|nr:MULTISPECIES: fumarate hydratase [unclassified Archaeoglobus]